MEKADHPLGFWFFLLRNKLAKLQIRLGDLCKGNDELNLLFNAQYKVENRTN